jgi:hypothetical protein
VLFKRSVLSVFISKMDSIEGVEEDRFRGQVSPFGGGMDWLELRLSAFTPFRPEVAEMVAEVRRGPPGTVRSSTNYRSVIDLRPRGIEAVLHLDKRHGESNHKVQMIGTGQFSMGEHVSHLESIVANNPLDLVPMRTDLTVDVANVPIGWVLDHAAVHRKRFTAHLGKTEKRADGFMSIAHREIETIYSGVRPNCYRVYNKTAERWAAYAKAYRGWHPREPKFKKLCKQIAGAEDIKAAYESFCFEYGLNPCPQYRLPKGADGESRELILEGTQILEMFNAAHAAWEAKVAEKGPKPGFEQFCGLREDSMLTRFERQMGSEEVGEMVDGKGDQLFGSMRDLRAKLPEFNPFTALSFSLAGQAIPALPNGLNYSWIEYMAGLYYRDRVRREGRQTADSWIRFISNGHGKKNLQRLAAFAPPADVVCITESELYGQYRDAVVKQMAA